MADAKLLSAEERGLTPILERAGWEPFTYRGQSGYRYPVHELPGGQGRVARRFKNFTSTSPKYAWLPTQPDWCHYYFLEPPKPDAGILYLVSGEPDVLVMNLAGFPNSLSWFGEGAVPPTLPYDLKRWDAHTARMLVDNDPAGFAAAAKVMSRLLNSGITFEAYTVGEGAKADANALWMAVGFDKAAFQARLLERPLDSGWVAMHMPVSDPAPPTSRTTRLLSTHAEPDTLKDWIESVDKALGSPRARRKIHCPLPEHPDEHPSFYVVSTPTGLRPRCNCKIQDCADAWEQIAAAIGHPPLSAHKESAGQKARGALRMQIAQPPVVLAPPPPPANGHKAAPPPPSAPAPQPEPAALKAQIIFTMEEAQQELALAIAGEPTHLGAPITFPDPHLWSLGGVFEMASTGQVIILGGGTGTGKTSLLNQWVKGWNADDEHAMVRSPEWPLGDHAADAIQRAGGPDYMTIMRHRAYEAAVAAGRTPGSNMRPMSPELMAAYAAASKRVRDQWTYLHLIDDRRAEGMLYLEDVLTTAVEEMKRLRENGELARIFCLDHLELEQMAFPSSSDNREEDKLSTIKNYAMKYDFLAVVVVQVTKSAETRALDTGRMFTEDDFYYVRGVKSNGIITINRRYQRDGNKAVVRDRQGMPLAKLGKGPDGRLLPIVTFYVCKSNKGAKYGGRDYLFDHTTMSYLPYEGGGAL